MAETAPPTAASTIASPKPDHIVFPIMPMREIHLISGPSNAGKTTITFQIIEEWQATAPVLGAYQAFPLPYVYVACDRSEAATRRTLKRIGINHKTIPILSLVDTVLADMSPSKVVEMARKRVQEARVLFIDAIAVLCPGKVTDYSVVCRFLAGTARLCQKEDITIIGLGHTPKVRGDDQVSDPRQRFLGSVAWGGFADCMIHIEPTDPDDPTNPNRRVYVLPKNTRSEILEYRFNDEGRLVSVTAETASLVMDQWYLKLSRGFPLTTGAITVAGESAGLSRASIFRWVKQAVSDGRLLKSGHGEYKTRERN